MKVFKKIIKWILLGFVGLMLLAVLLPIVDPEGEAERSQDRAERDERAALRSAERERAAMQSRPYTLEQQQFHALNKACSEDYEAGKNEIQMSMAFNRCNEARAAFASARGISEWTGTLTTISTDEGADVVFVSIESDVSDFELTIRTVNNRLSDMNSASMVTPENPLFGVLAEMEEGDKVVFSARFLPSIDDHRHIWEGSLTERGSMTAPDFVVAFTDIRPR